MTLPVASWASPQVAGAPPSAGAIQHDMKLPTMPPQAPGQVINLPAPQAQKLNTATTVALRQIIIQGNTLLPTTELAPLVDPLQGRTVTLADLQQGAAQITALYQKRGYPLAYAYLPAQQIKDGVVTMTVVEPRYDQISVTGTSRLDPAQARRTLGLQSGAPITQSALDRGLLLLNQTPGIRVAGTLIPGATPATTTLEARVSDTPAVRGSVSADDYGSPFTGRTRALANVSVDNPFGYGSQLSANGLTTAGGLLHAGGFSVQSPDVGDGGRFGVYASRTHYRLGGAFAALQVSGQAGQVGADFSIPLILEPGRILQARVDLLRNRFRETSAVAQLNDRSHVNLLRFTLNGALADAAGGLTSGGVVLTRGTMHFDSASAAVADAAGARMAGSFWSTQIQVQRTQPLPAGLSFKADLSGQLSSKNLNDSEKFYLGGPQAVMSTPVGEAGGDAGALLRLSLSHAIPLPASQQLEVAALLQGGQIWLNHNPYGTTSAQNRQHLVGAGVGLTYQWAQRINARLDYVHRLGSVPPVRGANSHGEL